MTWFRQGWLRSTAPVAIVLLAACGGSADNAAPEPTTATTASSDAITPTTVVPEPTEPSVSAVAVEAPVVQYTIVAGDSVYALAERYCVSPDAIPAANGWADGVDHLILPGDVIDIPSDECDVSTAGDGGANGGGGNKYLDQYLAEGIYQDPFQGEWGDTSYEPVCAAAFETSGLFSVGSASAAEVTAALSTLGEIPDDVAAAIAAWAPIVAEWAPRAREITQRFVGEFGGLTDEYFRTLLADPDYVELLDVVLPHRDDQVAALTHVETVCGSI